MKNLCFANDGINASCLLHWGNIIIRSNKYVEKTLSEKESLEFSGRKEYRIPFVTMIPVFHEFLSTNIV